MQKVLINKQGFLKSPYIVDADKEIEISDQLYNKIWNTPFYHAWQYNGNDFILVELLDKNILQDRRQFECFDIIDNRSPMWYARLSANQKQELDNWYQAWLDVTETKVIPTKPEWLK